MKILCLSDQECPAFWDYYVPGRLKDYDLILSCGDLKPAYLRFVVTMARCPVLYVHGNHDGRYASDPPEGCDCIDGQIVEYNGIRILGLPGCRKYHPGSHQYTEKEMRRMLLRVYPKLKWLGGVDIVLTHAPPEELGDDDDFAHRGFHCFRWLMDHFHPRYLIHGHVHLSYGMEHRRELPYGDTTVVNAFERYTIELPDRPTKKPYQLIYKTRKHHNFMDDVPAFPK